METKSPKQQFETLKQQVRKRLSCVQEFECVQKMYSDMTTNNMLERDSHIA